VSLPSTVFYFVFGGNVLLGWGLLRGPGESLGRSLRPLGSLALLAAASAASAVYGLAFRFLLMPLGLDSLAPALFMILVLVAYVLVSGIAVAVGREPGAHPSRFPSEVPLSLVLYVAALSVFRRAPTTAEVLAGGAAAAFGYLAADRVMADIMERLELESVPTAFRGYPIRLVTAGLVALAFSAADGLFFAGA